MHLNEKKLPNNRVQSKNFFLLHDKQRSIPILEMFSTPCFWKWTLSVMKQVQYISCHKFQQNFGLTTWCHFCWHFWSTTFDQLWFATSQYSEEDMGPFCYCCTSIFSLAAIFLQLLSDEWAIFARHCLSRLANWDRPSMTSRMFQDCLTLSSLCYHFWKCKCFCTYIKSFMDVSRLKN